MRFFCLTSREGWRDYRYPLAGPIACPIAAPTARPRRWREASELRLRDSSSRTAGDTAAREHLWFVRTHTCKRTMPTERRGNISGPNADSCSTAVSLSYHLPCTRLHNGVLFDTAIQGTRSLNSQAGLKWTVFRLPRLDHTAATN